jgi:tetratricopeptide (TPR) repeat protein
MHAIVAAYFEKRAQTNDPARLSELAWHYARAEQPERAWPLYYRAGLKAAEDWLLAFAAAQFRSAKEEFDRCKVAPGIDGLSPEGSRLKLLLALCEACFDSGKPDEALKYAEEAIALTPDGFARQRASAFEFAARIAQIKSRFDDAIVHAERASALHDKSGDGAGVSRMTLFKARMLAHIGQSAAGLELLEELTFKDANIETRIDFHHTRASLQSGLGRLKEALEDETKRLALATSVNDRRKIAGAHSNIATYLSDMGRSAEADQHFQLAMAEYTRAGELFNVAIVHGNYGNQLRRARRLDEAVQHHTLARGLCRELGDEFGIMVAETNLGTCFMALGDFTEAKLSFERAVPLAERFGSAQAMSQLLHNQATVALRTGDAALCRERLERSREINAKQGNERGLLLNDNLAAQDSLRLGNLDQASRELASVAERAAKLGFAGYEAAAYLHMLEVARQKGNAVEMRRMLDVLERCLPETSGGSDEKALRQAHRLAAACLEPGDENVSREVAKFAELAPKQVATSLDAEALAIAASSLAKNAKKWPQAATWAEQAVAALEKGGRQDLMYVEALFARGQFRQAAGEHGSTDQVRSGRFSARLGLNWLLERLQEK